MHCSIDSTELVLFVQMHSRFRFRKLLILSMKDNSVSRVKDLDEQTLFPIRGVQ